MINVLYLVECILNTVSRVTGLHHDLRSKKDVLNVLNRGYMYNKAMINNEPETARKTCYTTDPREIKRLGSSVSVTNGNEWNNLKKTLMLELVRAKYTQNEADFVSHQKSERSGEIPYFPLDYHSPIPMY